MNKCAICRMYGNTKLYLYGWAPVLVCDSCINQTGFNIPLKRVHSIILDVIKWSWV